ncbi:MAG: competence protein [Enterococcus sp.]|nr:competence protein [Enterococcus sp.]
MLIAQTKLGERKLASACFKKEKEQYFCPSCQKEVLLKKGSVKRAHFAHRHLTTCAAFSEGETVEHLAGKFLLAEWTKNGELEAYLPELKQRPDVRWGQIAFEFQCSPLPLERFLERTTNYQKHDYVPWWLLGQALLPKGAFSQLVKACCFYHSKDGIQFWGMDVKSEAILLYHQIAWHFAYPVYYEIQRFDLCKYSVREVLATPVLAKKRVLPWQISHFKQVLTKKLYYQNPTILKLQTKIYELGGHLLYLPEWCYRNSRYFFFFEEELLYLRYAYCQTESFVAWKEIVTPFVKPWSYPFIPLEKILTEVYAECVSLQKIIFF